MVFLSQTPSEIKSKTKDLAQSMLEEDLSDTKHGGEKRPNSKLQSSNPDLGGINEKVIQGMRVDRTSKTNVDCSIKVDGKIEATNFGGNAATVKCAEGARPFACEGHEHNTNLCFGQARSGINSDLLSPIERLQKMLADSKKRCGESDYAGLVAESAACGHKNTVVLDEMVDEYAFPDCDDQMEIVKHDKVEGKSECSSKEGESISTQGARQIDAKKSGVGKCSTKNDVLLLPKELYNEIEAMGVGEKGGVASRKGVSYRDIVTEASNNIQESNAGEGTCNYRDEIEPSVRANVELKYYTVDEGPVELIPDELILERLNNCVVAYFLGDKLGFPETEKELRRLWPCLTVVKRNTKGFFFLSFEKESDMDQFLENSHCYIFGRIMVVKKWHRMLKLTKEALEVIPVWVRFYDLPLEFWSIDNLSKLASKIGRPRYVDRATEKMLSVTYARVCIEIDASSQLPNILQIKNGDEIVDVEVRYQWLPPRCEECKVFGHRETYCQKVQVRDKGNEAYPLRSGNIMSGNRWRERERIRVDQNGNNYGGQGDVIEPTDGRTNWGTHKREMVGNSWRGEEEWQNGKRRPYKLINRYGKVANIGTVNKKYVEVHKEEGVKVGNSFDAIAEVPKESGVGKHPSDSGVDESKMDIGNGERVVLKEECKETKQEICNLGKESVADGSGMECENVVTNITPVKVMKGLSIEDYPKDWSRKKIKREIKAKRNALDVIGRKNKDPP